MASFKATMKALLLLFPVLSALEAQQRYTISTYAGGAPPLTPVAGTQAFIGAPQGVATDAEGNAYFSAANCVFKLDPSGQLTLVAGNSRAGYSGDGGPATSAQLNTPMGLAVAPNGDVYIADDFNNCVRKVSGGIITTVLALGGPAGLALDAAGNLYIADGAVVFKVSAAGVVTVAAGCGAGCEASGWGDGGPAASAFLADATDVAVDTAGNLYIADSAANLVRKVSVGGVISTVVGQSYSLNGAGPSSTGYLSRPNGIAVDASGNLYIADTGHNFIQELSVAGVITTVAGTGAEGDIGDGGPAASAHLTMPTGVAADAAGNVYIADYGDSLIRKVSAAGIITAVAGDTKWESGDGGPATLAQLGYPTGVAVDTKGKVYIPDPNSAVVRMISPEGVITTVAGTGTPGVSLLSGPALGVPLSRPAGVAADAGGNLYIADSRDNAVFKISPEGIRTTVAGVGEPGFGGDGGPAVDAALSYPVGVATDASGNLYIADFGNNRVRKVSPAGIISTLGGYLVTPPPTVAADSAGNVYIAEGALVREISAAGSLSVVAGAGSSVVCRGDGGPATDVQLYNAAGVAVDQAGNLYIADSNCGNIRKVSTAGIISTIAGNGANSYSGDGGLAINAELNFPQGLAVDANGRVFVADSLNNAIRLLTPSDVPCAYTLSSPNINIPNNGGSYNLTITTTADCVWSMGSLPDWVTANLQFGSGSGTVFLTVAENPTFSPRTAQVQFGAAALTFSQAPQVLLLSSGGVVNGADFVAPVVPGSVISIFGNFGLQTFFSASVVPLPTSLGGLSLQFDGTLAAPLFFAAYQQVDAQLPWELAGLSQATVTAYFGSQTSAPQPLSIAPYAPGIFSLYGAGIGAITDTEGNLTIGSNWATRGVTVVEIYCTGLGPVTNQPATGAASPSDPLARTTTQPIVTIGGATATVSFSGLAPGEVGVYQINALVPPDATPGMAVPVTISIGGVTSNTVTTGVN